MYRIFMTNVEFAEYGWGTLSSYRASMLQWPIMQLLLKTETWAPVTKKCTLLIHIGGRR